MLTTIDTPAVVGADPILLVFDDVLPHPERYRAWALAQTFREHVTGDEHWKGIALLEDQTLPTIVEQFVQGAKTHLTFFRQSPLGQTEPNFIHSDEGMGQWTAILYLNPTPAPGDGTTFWKFTPTGAVYGSAREIDKAPALWTPWEQVEAKFNRLLIFDSLYFHSRAIEENYGHGADARLVQVAFGTRPC